MMRSRISSYDHLSFVRKLRSAPRGRDKSGSEDEKTRQEDEKMSQEDKKTRQVDKKTRS